MKVIKVISISTFLFMVCLIENYLNTFISLDFGVYIFLISLIYIGTEFFNQNLSQITNISNNIKVMINKMDYEKLKLYIHKNKNKLGDNVNFIADKDVKSVRWG